MKKLFLTIALATSIVVANAQTMTSKNGTPILPESGDYSIGFDANPLLRYVGNFFNQAGSNNIGMAYQENMVLVGKYMKDANTAYRGKLALNFGSSTTEVDPEGTPGGDSLTTPSKVKLSSNKITLGAGIQKYRGKGRLQGIYGAEANIGLGGGKTTHEFAKPFSATSPIGSSRTAEVKNGSTFSFGVRGFVGAEFFFAPKMSFGAEYGWGISIGSTGASEATVESWDGTTVKSTTSKGSKSSNFDIGVDNASGSITLNLYF